MKTPEKLLKQTIFVLGFFIFLLMLITIIIKSNTKDEDISIYHEVSYEQTAVVTATVYHATSNQCDNTPNITACGIKFDTSHSDTYRFVAVSPDFLNGKNKELQLEFGDTIQVDGTWIYDGLWIVVDKTNKRYTNHIDFLIAKGQFVNKWDSCVIIKKYKSNY